MRILFSALLALCFTSAAFAQKDPVEGFWFNDKHDAKIQIYKAADGYFWGKVVWLKVPDRDGKPKTDERNENEKLRSRPILGMAVLSHFEKDGDDEYDDGKIYDPKNGKTYRCTMTLKDANTLSVRGYIGVSAIGRTMVFTRAAN